MVNKISLEAKKELVRLLTIRIAKESFFEYCNTLAPDYYTPNRPHLVKLCQTFDDLYNGRLLKPTGTPYTMKEYLEYAKLDFTSADGIKIKENFKAWLLFIGADEEVGEL